MKKKLLASLMAAAMVLSLCACGQKNDEVVKDDGTNGASELNIGYINNFFSDEVFSKHKEEAHSEETLEEHARFHTYSNLSAALLDMENAKIINIALSKSAADYIAAHNDKFQAIALTEYEDGGNVSHFSMITTDTNTELYDILDCGIKQLKENGTLDKLIEEDLNAYITSDPTPEVLPTFDGAATYKIAVTGDMPPMDFVAADGKASGFNVALLTEIANIAQVNFEIVQIDSGARLTSLASGAVDAVFWVESSGCVFCGEMINDAPEGTLITETYFSDVPALLFLK